MSLHHWLRNLRSAFAQGQSDHRALRRAATHRPRLEVLEDRTVPSFADPVSYDVSTGPWGVVTADFNGDGRLDLAVGGVSILLGNADGTFQAARNYAVGYGHSPAVGDFNGDSTLDLVVPQFTNNSGQASVLLGNGDGSFQGPRTVSAGGSVIQAVAVADFNGDGREDLAVAGYNNPYFGGRIDFTMLLGNGDGTFDVSYDYVSSVYDDGSIITSMAVGDFNGDGKVDLASVGSGGGSVGLGNGDGTFHGSQLFATDYPYSVAVADLNGDDKPDLVTANQFGSVSVLLGYGDGTFQNATDYACDNYPLSVAVADFNADGKPDLVTAGWKYSNGNYNSPPIGVTSVFLGNGDGSFQAAQYNEAGSDTEWLAAGDFNGDGRPDVAVADHQNGVALVLLNAGDWGSQTSSLKINDVTVAEGNTGTRAATFTVTLSTASSQTITVAYATGNDTATAGSDYTSTSGTLTFAPGQTSKTITVLVKGDRLPEPNETFFVNLSSPTNATIADGLGVGTIVDDEPRISISDVSKKEGKKGHTTQFTFTVALSAAYDQAVTMSFRTVDSTATAGDQDYVAKTGTLTFAPGETTKTITIAVKGDSKKESNETFYLDLSGLSSNGLFTKNRGVGTILNDD